MGFSKANPSFSDGSSADLCGILGVSMADDLANVDDFESLKQFDEELELDDDFGSTTLSSDLVMEGDTLSRLGLGSLDGLVHSEELVVDIDYLEEALGHEIDAVDEEALLLGEADKNFVPVSHENSGKRTVMGSPERSSSDTTSTRRNSDPEQRGKGIKATSGKRKTKVDWTPELHRRFVQAVDQLGVDKAIPSRILEIMGVQCLTRHNIASHLQKYRSHRKHLLVREAEAANWNHRRHVDAAPWARPRMDDTSCWHPPQLHPNVQPKPIPPLSLTPIQAHGHPIAPPLLVWGHPTVDHSQMYMWQKPPLAAPPWLASNLGYWQQQACIDAWGHPAHASAAPGMPCCPQGVMRLPLAPMPGVANMALLEDTVDASNSTVAAGNGRTVTSHLPKETVDAAINEVLINPSAPLPLGLKAPSLESVIMELQRQGICTAPPESLKQ